MGDDRLGCIVAFEQGLEKHSMGLYNMQHTCVCSFLFEAHFYESAKVGSPTIHQHLAWSI